MGDIAKKAGRPINPEAGEALRSAALRLVREEGYEKVSISAIVKEAGVARQTLYNRWDTKAELVLEAVFEETARQAAPPTDDRDLPYARLLADFLQRIFAHLERDGDTMRALIAAAQQDPSFGNAFHQKFVAPREAMVTDLLRRAQAAGQLDPARDADLLSQLIHGALWYRLLNDKPVDADFACQVVAEVFRTEMSSGN
ncbi:TetR/AcrR family transcriptional regulator [Paracoccus sp. 1_MG-2023]|uniref:TetR/AcrR family transcriptional regulator n=1 Tax=unclassified Paracoccus (in: a-proteobacteria) TaxID=2688777 RepID=UPI0026E31CAE|nr:TetR/AcrR family transcriptional regulator [Paracoccus sp. 1_MG-2023]MDO6670266.1 TetR/AcrR family transcriptional regulator [Paracoccus sp. 1_MG-2023]